VNSLIQSEKNRVGLHRAFMRIITLTTDLGHSDPYVAMVKGTLYRLYSKVQVIDISHEVPPFDRLRCAYLLRWAYPSFPENSIHIFACDSGNAQSGYGIAVKFNGHYFIGPDNGIMGLISLGEDIKSHKISNPNLLPDAMHRSFIVRDVYAYTAAFIASGAPLEEVGEEIIPVFNTNREPLASDPVIRGEIIHIDHFGNCITNITRSVFTEMKKNRGFKIVFRNHELYKIYLEYDRSIEGGDPIALFGQYGHLEIAALYGSASTLFGLNIGHTISLEFLNK